MMFEKGYEYVKNSKMYYQPKTPFSALRAAEAGLLPPEAFIFKATSVEPIADNPENLEEIERILAQKNRDLETNKLLMDILSKLIKNSDKEIALFAAESINAIESSYNTALEALKDSEYRGRAELYIEMAELNKASTDIKNFYLKEAFSNYRELEKLSALEENDFLKMARILIELNLVSQAKKILTDNGINSIEAVFIMAETAFRLRDFSELYRIVQSLNKRRDMMDANQKALVDYWIEGK